MDDVRAYIAHPSNRREDQIENADTALAAVAAERFDEGDAEFAYIMTADVDAGDGIVSATGSASMSSSKMESSYSRRLRDTSGARVGAECAPIGVFTEVFVDVSGDIWLATRKGRCRNEQAVGVNFYTVVSLGCTLRDS